MVAIRLRVAPIVPCTISLMFPRMQIKGDVLPLILELMAKKNLYS